MSINVMLGAGDWLCEDCWDLAEEMVAADHRCPACDLSLCDGCWAEHECAA